MTGKRALNAKNLPRLGAAALARAARDAGHLRLGFTPQQSS